MASFNPQNQRRMKKRAHKEEIKSINYAELISHANESLRYCAVSLAKCNVLFNSDINGLDPVTQISSLVADRISNKFSVKSQGEHLRDAAITAFVEYEKQLKDFSDTWSISDSPLLWTLRRRLRVILSGYAIDYSKDIDVGPGETYISSGGMTQLIAKLSDRDHWTTTEHCLEETVRLIYEHRALKRAAKLLMPVLTRNERISLYAQYRSHPNPGYACFHHVLCEHVLTIVPGSRGATVPKNASTDRFINIEPLFPMILQRYVAAALKKCLKRHGNALIDCDNYHDRQALHADKISNRSYATIDFKNASDSVMVKVIQSLFPQRVVSDLLNFRSTSVSLSGNPHELIKLSSMGNGFTFETMTCLLLGACKVFTDDCTVYGDDVIIPNAHAEEFIGLCASFGFNTNIKKTFVDSDFRESCGAFYSDSVGYIRSFDIRFCESYNDVITAHNKIVVILKKHKAFLNEATVSILEDTLNLLRQDAARSRSCHCPDTEDMQIQNLGLYFFKDNARRKAISDPALNARWSKWVDKLGGIIDALQWNVDPTGTKSASWVLQNYMIVNVSMFTSKRVNLTRHRTVTDLVRLRSGRPVRETIRGKGRWCEPLALVELTTGRVFLLNKLLLAEKLHKVGIYYDPQLR